MFDPGNERMENPVTVEMDDHTMRIFEGRVTKLHDEIKKEATRILRAKIVQNCQNKDLPWTVNLSQTLDCSDNISNCSI